MTNPVQALIDANAAYNHEMDRIRANRTADLMTVKHTLTGQGADMASKVINRMADAAEHNAVQNFDFAIVAAFGHTYGQAV